MGTSEFATLLAPSTSGLNFQENAWLALIGGVVSLLLAMVSATIAYFSAQANFNRELERFREQIRVQKEVEYQEQFTTLKQKYLAPLRGYAQILALRFDAIITKLTLKEEADKMSGWFKLLKDHVTHDNRYPSFQIWSCYEGVFSISTLYYTGCYFQCARELMAHVPFREILPRFSLDLEIQLEKVGQAFVWDNGERGIWVPLQEVIGDAFTTAPATRMSYSDLCRDLDVGDAFHRAPYLRPIDFFWWQLKPENAANIRDVLNALVHFLDSYAPDTREKLFKIELASAEASLKKRAERKGLP